MQRTRINGRLILKIAIPVIMLIVLIAFDQIVKGVFNRLGEFTRIKVIGEFFQFYVCFNDAAAFGSFSFEGAQIFFRVITIIALIGFSVFWAYAYKKNKTFLKYAITSIIAGVIGNFIDRLAYGYVVDFIYFNIFPFPFNIADSCIVVGVILTIIYYFFLDENPIIPIKKKSLKLDKTNADVNTLLDVTEDAINEDEIVNTDNNEDSGK